MKDEDKSKEQLLKELKELRRQTQEEVSKGAALFSEARLSGPDGGEPNTIRVSGIQMEWDPKGGTCTFEKLPVAMMWVDTTLAGLMSGVQAMVGTERFLLALQSEGRKSVEADWRVISKFSEFSRGFKAIANIARVAGWGAWELTSLDSERRECRFRVADSWEGLYQKALDVCWGSGMLAGKLAGYCSKLFGTNCWADQVGFITKGDPYDEFIVRTSPRSIEQEIENLFASDEATRADMAVALRKLEKEIAERQRAEEALREAHQKLQAIIQASPLSIFVLDPEGKVLMWNPASTSTFGWTEEEAVDRVLPIVPEEKLEEFRDNLRRAVAGEPLREMELRRRKKGGTPIDISISTSTLYDAQGNVTGIMALNADITERKKAADALRQSEEKYRLLVNQIPAVVFKGYPDWSVDFFDNKIEALTGYGKAEFDSRQLKWSEVILDDDFQEVKRKSREAIKTCARTYEREYRLREKDGGIAWVQAMGQIFYDAAGKFDYVSGVFFNITERKRAEEALLKYKFIANTAKDCMTLIDRNYIYEAANAAYCQAHGKTREEVVGTSVANIWGKDAFKNNIKDYLDRCFTGQTVEFEGWFEFGKKGRGCYHVFYSPYFNEDGTVAYAAVVSHDITARKRVEEALRQSEVKYRQLVDQIPAVVYKGYTDWSLDCFDRKIEVITGYSMEEFNSRRKTWLDLIFPEDLDQAKKLFREALKDDGSYVPEHRIRKKNGEVRWIQARNRIIRDAAGKIDYISGVFFDITERKELADQLIKAQRMEAVGILAGGLAHDFNNLLTAIMGYGEIMMMDLRKEDPFSVYINEITKAASRGASLTNQLLAFSRKQILQPQVVNLNDVVVDMDKMLRRLIGEDIDLVTCIDQELGLVKADPGQIEQIIMNLAVNARDAMPNGGSLTLETANVYLDQAYARSHVGVSPGHCVMLAVSDNGVGMDAETVSHIFEPFFTTKESGKGTGLGLATIYGIVQQSGGHIWVYSEPGKGTTFKVYLPTVEEGVLEPKPRAAPPPPWQGLKPSSWWKTMPRSGI